MRQEVSAIKKRIKKRERGTPSDYIVLANKKSGVQCERLGCQNKINMLTLSIGDRYCSRGCHDFALGITHPSTVDLVGSLRSGE